MKFLSVFPNIYKKLKSEFLPTIVPEHKQTRMTKNLSRWNFISRDKTGALSISRVRASELVRLYGTPLYVLAESEIRERFRRFRKAFPYPKLEVQYAAKCNSNLEVLRMARSEGAEIDASSVGEIMLAILADFRPSQITLTNLYKGDQDILFAAKVGVKAITIDAVEEIGKIAAVGRHLGKKIPVFLRINPQIRLGRYSTMYHKYGIPLRQVKDAIDETVASGWCELVGLHFHGSYIDNPRIYSIAAERLVKTAAYCIMKGADIKYIDLGGGFPIEHEPGKKCFQPEDMGPAFVRHFRSLLAKNGITSQPTLIFEPGKFVVANAGIGLVRVVSVKELNRKKIAVTDGSTYAFLPDVLAMDWHYEILPASGSGGGESEKYDVAGLTCDSIDLIGRDRKLPRLEAGDLLAVMDCGAYSSVMSSNFNTLRKAAVVVVRDGKARLVRRRDRYAEMFAPELDVLKLADGREFCSLASKARAHAARQAQR